MPTSLRNGLGGASGFGESFLARGDDNSSAFIDLTPVFANGLNFGGAFYTGIYLNTNGSISFGGAVNSLNTAALNTATGRPIIAAFNADVDTRPTSAPVSPGGTSTGSNLVWYDFETTPIGRFTATWDDVGYFSSKTDKTNAFQIELSTISGAAGDFVIRFRYENVSWTSGDVQSPGDDGLGGTVARAGFSAGDGVRFHELPQSGDQAAMLDLENASNTVAWHIPTGTFYFEMRGGQVVNYVSIGDVSVVEGNAGTTNAIVPVALSVPGTTPITIQYTTANGTAVAGQDFVAQSGTLTFQPGVTRQNIVIAVNGDTAFEPDETFMVNLSNPTGGAVLSFPHRGVTITNDDTRYTIFNAQPKPEGNSGTTAFSFSITREGSLGPATVDWEVDAALSQTDGADFPNGTVPSGTALFAASVAQVNISVNVAGDTIIETDETFTVRIRPPAGATTAAATATATILADDTAYFIRALSADMAEGDSGSTPFTFRISRSGSLDAAGVNWNLTAGGSPAPASDFLNGVTSGTVSFGNGETRKDITINVAGDRRVEADETFTVNLVPVSGGGILSSVNGVIRNDDVNVAPVATPTSFVQQLARINPEPILSSLVSATDANGESMTRWQFWDNTPGSGTILTPGGATAAQTLIDLTAAELANSFYGSEGGYDNIYARAFDGTAWSEWTNFWVVAPPNNAPVVTAPFAFLTRANANPKVATLFGITDADGDRATGWQLWDNTPGNGSFIDVSGSPLPAQTVIDLIAEAVPNNAAADEFANVRFRSTTGFDEVYVRAFDGFEWSAWKQTYIVAPVNTAPEVTASSVRMPNGVIGLSLSGLVSATDAEGDAIQKWQIWDVTPDGGSLFAKNVYQPAMTGIELTPTEFSTARISGGAAGDSYWIRGFDGFDWSEWENFTVTAPASNTVPVITPAQTTFSGANVARPLANLFNYADPQSAALYQLWDNTPGNGAFRLNGIQQAAQTVIEVYSSQLTVTNFTSGAGDDDVYIRAWDGYDWSAWTLLKMDNLLA